MQPVFLSFTSQQAQPNGFWLVNLTLSAPFDLPINFQFNEGGFQGALFQQSGLLATFLTQQPWPATQAPIEFKNNQAWCFLDDFLRKIQPAISAHTPLLLKASNLQMAHLFLLVRQIKSTLPLAALLHTSEKFPFVQKPAKMLFPTFSPQAIGACPLLDDWGIPNRLLSDAPQMGCLQTDFEGLAEQWSPPMDWQVIDLSQPINC